MMTDYVLAHSAGREIILLYESASGVTERCVRVLNTNDRLLRAVEGDTVKTFRRDRVLAAGWKK